MICHGLNAGFGLKLNVSTKLQCDNVFSPIWQNEQKIAVNLYRNLQESTFITKHRHGSQDIDRINTHIQIQKLNVE